ncbi:MAG: protein-L-isoaspartate(D-aspartate) O-methyltransferase [Proteobacteria bacterium]|nr:protein-L-isoaspartate(D-aspartate) O-methyltransferase [Pseudomonadota bacterium]
MAWWARREEDAKARLMAEIAAEFAECAAYLGRSAPDPRVMAALAAVPREEFVRPSDLASAYDNRPLPIGHGQTISQPFIVAAMTDLLALEPADRVLEVGTGSGYQTAVLARLAAEVYTVEKVAALARAAEARFERLKIGNVHVRVGDGAEGWPEAAPFDAIIVTAAAPLLPPALASQLGPGGRLVIPIEEGGGRFSASRQILALFTRAADGRLARRDTLPVAFVPFVSDW